MRGSRHTAVHRWLTVVLALWVWPAHGDVPPSNPANLSGIPLWQNQIPSALAISSGSAQRLADLSGNAIVLYSHPRSSINLPSSSGLRQYTNAPFSTAALVVNASPAQVQQLLSQYTGYAGLFPSLTSATRLRTQGSSQLLRYQIRVPIPLPLLSFSDHATLWHQQQGNRISSLIVDSPVRYGAGHFEWFALNQRQTLVTLTQWGDLNQTRGFLVGTIFKAMPEIKLGIPHGVGAFVLESLRRRLQPDAPNRLVVSADQATPVLQLSHAQWQMVDAWIQRSNAPMAWLHPPVRTQAYGQVQELFFVSTVTAFAAPSSAVQAVLFDPSAYPRFLRQVSRVRTQALADATGVDADVRVRMGLGVIAIPFDLKLRYQTDSANSVRFRAIGGDLRWMQGRLQVDALGAGRSRVLMTSAGRVDDDAPFLLRLGQHLPYAELLPSVGAAPIFLHKAQGVVEAASTPSP